MKDLRFGIEIETIAPNFRVVAQAIQTVVGGSIEGPDFRGALTVRATDGRGWKVERDGSLAPSAGQRSFIGAEIVSPILGWPDIEQLQEIVRAVRRAGATTNQTCGIHVHVDVATLPAKAVANLIKMVYKQEALIEAALGIHTSRKRYCQSIDPEFVARLSSRRTWTMQDLNRAWFGYDNPHPARYDHTRYRTINLNSIWVHQTVEFRWANGTLHAGQVKTYIQFALALAAKARSARGAQSARREFNPASAKYDMRVFLLGLGFIGPEYKTARDHLLSRLGGSAAWKNGRPAEAPAAPGDDEEAV